MSLNFKAEKKGKKARNEKNCDTRTSTYDEIKRNFEKSSGNEINL